MAEPNIVNVTSIYGRTRGYQLGTTANTTTLSCSSNKVIKINSIIVSNVDGTNDADVNIDFYDSSATVAYAIAHTITVAADSTFVALGKDSPIYLEEGDTVRAWASAAGDLEMIISYEEIDDA